MAIIWIIAGAFLFVFVMLGVVGCLAMWMQGVWMRRMADMNASMLRIQQPPPMPEWKPDATP